MSDSDPASAAPVHGNRLSTALRLSLQFRSSGRTDVDAFLAAHDDLRDLIEPMIRGRADDDAADHAVPPIAPEAPSGSCRGRTSPVT